MFLKTEQCYAANLLHTYSHVDETVTTLCGVRVTRSTREDPKCTRRERERERLAIMLYSKTLI